MTKKILRNMIVVVETNQLESPLMRGKTFHTGSTQNGNYGHAIFRKSFRRPKVESILGAKIFGGFGSIVE